MKFIIVNGPNLNLLGAREPSLYGKQTFEEFLQTFRLNHPQIQIDFYQSNIEGELIDKLQQADSIYQGIVLNAAAYTHTSIGIGDVVKAIQTPVVEVHISNVYAREVFRQTSFISPNAAGIIVGCGLHGYALAIQQLIHIGQK